MGYYHDSLSSFLLFGLHLIEGEERKSLER